MYNCTYILITRQSNTSRNRMFVMRFLSVTKIMKKHLQNYQKY